MGVPLWLLTNVYLKKKKNYKKKYKKKKENEKKVIFIKVLVWEYRYCYRQEKKKKFWLADTAFSFLLQSAFTLYNILYLLHTVFTGERNYGWRGHFKRKQTKNMHAEFQSKGKLTEEKALVDVEFGPLPPPTEGSAKKKVSSRCFGPVLQSLQLASSGACRQTCNQRKEGSMLYTYSISWDFIIIIIDNIYIFSSFPFFLYLVLQ